MDGIRALQPDLVITDLALPGRSGIELLEEIRRLSPGSRRMVLTAHDNEEYIRAALNADADGYVLKDANSAELMGDPYRIGRSAFSIEAIASKILSGYLSGEQKAPFPAVAQSITGREREVLTRMAFGQFQ